MLSKQEIRKENNMTFCFELTKYGRVPQHQWHYLSLLDNAVLGAISKRLYLIFGWADRQSGWALKSNIGNYALEQYNYSSALLFLKKQYLDIFLKSKNYATLDYFFKQFMHQFFHQFLRYLKGFLVILKIIFKPLKRSKTVSLFMCDFFDKIHSTSLKFGLT